MNSKLVTLFLAILVMTACKKDKTTPYTDPTNPTPIGDVILNGSGNKHSKYGESESHNMGLACATCHNPNGPGEGSFTIGSTVYRNNLTSTYPNTTVKLYTGPGGTGEMKYKFEVDGRGNFYSTSTLNMQTGLYPAVEGDLSVKYMSSPITTGNCTSCHGNTTSRIWTE